MKWEPIDTAPKDGTNVLVLIDCAGTFVAHIAFYRGREEWENSGKYCYFEEWNGWWSYVRGCVSQEKLDDWRLPKFWMPFDEPPAGSP